jgi:hypothetical protein
MLEVSIAAFKTMRALETPAAAEPTAAQTPENPVQVV